MLTLPMVSSERSYSGASASTRAERPSTAESFERPADAPRATFSQAADTRRAGAATLDTLIEQLEVGVLVVDEDSRVSYANAAARQLEAESLPSFHRAVARALLTAEVACEEVELRGPRGALRWLGIRAVPVRNADAHAHGAVVSVDDLTSQKRAKEWAPLIESLKTL
ncbi:MAG: PAS domain-containing protein [Gemmatimonadaceae bacterium]